MARATTAWTDGWRRVLKAPWLLGGVLGITLLLAIPPAMVLRGLLTAQLNRSLVAEEVARGVDSDWWQEFLAQASGLGTTFSPRIVGFAATLDSLTSVADTRAEIVPIAALLVAYVLLWTYLSAGIIDRFARQRRIGAPGFWAACGARALGFSVLAICGGIAYGWTLGLVHPWLLDTMFTRLTRDLDSERLAFLWRVAGYAVVGVLLAAINVILDYAKIRMVVEDRRSGLGSLLAACRFVGRNLAPVSALYLLNASSFAALLAAWAVFAPAPGAAGVRMWLALALGQLFIVARLACKLQFLASQTALFQRSLAHERFTAAPVPRWPDAPVVEALGPPPGGTRTPST